MKEIFINFTTSGFEFSEERAHRKAQYQTLNVGILLTSVAIIYGIIGNIIRDIEGYIPIELAILFVNVLLIVSLRKFPKAFKYIVIVMVSQFTFLFLFLLYISEPSSMKFLWIYTYPIILLYLQDGKRSIYWVAFLLLMLIIGPLQDIVEVKYTLYQATYMSAVMIIINTIMYFYQLKMTEVSNKIIQQQHQLHEFNINLEAQVFEKTSALQELNESLEEKVEEKLEELRAKDKILQIQSKQAVMGEMISMIAHQWRQPLSTITLQIANLQFKKLLGQDASGEETDKALSDISDTIIYLSDTVDDFQTYFHPDKEMSKSEVYELLQRAINFSAARIKEGSIDVEISNKEKIYISTYPNEFIQVVLNIFNNALDALKEIKKEKPFIKIDVQDNDKMIFINITDNAAGIKPENISKLFEPYFSTKGKNGTGLGLYMSKMIVEKQFNGIIKVKSSSKGTTFTIQVPKNI